MILEGTVLRRIFGPNREADKGRRMKTTIDINNHKIVNFIGSLTKGCQGHVINMDYHILTKKYKPKESRRVGRPKIRWDDELINDLKKMKVINLKVAEYGRSWKRIIEKTKTFKFKIVVPSDDDELHNPGRKTPFRSRVGWLTAGLMSTCLQTEFNAHPTSYRCNMWLVRRLCSCFVRFLDQKYRYKSIAIEIIKDVTLASTSYTLIHWPKIPSTPGIEPVPHRVVRVQSTLL